jgi:lysozyme family protein
MTRFRWCVERIIDLIEGGVSNDPDDPGGLTKFGISQRSYPLLDIANLTRSEAIAIYERDFWQGASCPALPEPLDFYVFDAAINQGASYAKRELQRLVRVHDDGVIGPITLRAVQRMGYEVGPLYMVERAFDYAALTNYSRYGRGWLKRLFIIAGAR